MKQEISNRIFIYDKEVERNLMTDFQADSFLDEYKALVLKNYSQDIVLRYSYANNIFGLVCIYLVVVGFIVVSSGRTFVDFHLSDSVLITLLTTTTANVLTLFVLVVKYLFPSNKQKL